MPKNKVARKGFKVGEVVVAELGEKGYTKSRYSLWNDNYKCIRVDV